MVLTQGVLYIFKSAYPGAKWKDPQGAFLVIGASCDVSNKSASNKSAFAVRAPEGQLLFSTEDENDMNSWIRSIREAADAHTANPGAP